MPPFTPETSPFTKDVAGEGTNTTARATSSARPSRPNGMILIVRRVAHRVSPEVNGFRTVFRVDTPICRW